MDELEGLGTIANGLRATYASALGWTVTPHERGPTHDSDSYVKGDLHVWRFSQGWQSARLEMGRYTRHFPFATFREAMEAKPCAA
jgi:hypothetical protein